MCGLSLTTMRGPKAEDINDLGGSLQGRFDAATIAANFERLVWASAGLRGLHALTNEHKIVRKPGAQSSRANCHFPIGAMAPSEDLGYRPATKSRKKRVARRIVLSVVISVGALLLSPF